MLNKNENLREKELVKVRENFQVTIPSNLRRLMDLGVGDYVEINFQGGRLVIKPVKVVPSLFREIQKRL